MKVEFILCRQDKTENNRILELDGEQIMALNHCQEVLYPERTGAFSRVTQPTCIERRVFDISFGEPVLRIYLRAKTEKQD